ncbi:PepSY domain-containing protein [Crocosphaera sp. XPORK-15E]|uniref:PepSY domain-containing protein n=1 Tax=Crocosphaera sp. XPORK-15E TaxID=3110247 RepID=UPI002B1F9998|nr:PepSY domain-containing protein [Crocosphaera sp. XPORK-15E]MEA5535331.1 PepSY domain-containing protein [Crocosphaera sp. XPORK-15E]
MISKKRLRNLHYTLAPLMIFPLLLTAITGSLFQVAELTGNGREFSWLLALHRGKFGMIDLRMVYPFLNAFGILLLGVTGILMWLQVRRKI